MRNLIKEVFLFKAISFEKFLNQDLAVFSTLAEVCFFDEQSYVEPHTEPLLISVSVFSLIVHVKKNQLNFHSVL